MTTRAMGPGRGWAWLVGALNLGRGNPRAVIGGIVLLVLLMLVPSVIQLLFQSVLGAGPGMVLAVAGATTLLSIVLLPLLVGGMLRIIDATERGLPVGASAIFDAFRSGNGGGRLIGFGVLGTVLYLLVFGTIVGVSGNGFLDWYTQLMTLSMESGGKPLQPSDIPPPPDGLGTMMALIVLFGMFIGGVYAIGFGQVALGGRGALAALGDGLAGALKNLLPIALLALLLFVGFFIAMLVVGLVGGLLMVAGGLIHPALGALLAMPVYLGLLVLIYVVMFGTMYHLWRDVCGPGDAPPPLPADRLEL